MTLDKLKLFINITFAFVDKGKLSEILFRYGYERDSMTPEFVYVLILSEPKFAAQYGVLVKEAMRSSEWYNSVKFNKFAAFIGAIDKVANGEPVASSQAKVLDWITGISNSLSGILNSGRGVIDTLDIKGTNGKIADAILQQAQADKIRTERRTSIGLIAAIAVGFVLLVGLIVIVTRRR